MKVWFIKNYMSPQMRGFVPRMAQQYGFDCEFVTYKWPSWLHKQVQLCVSIYAVCASSCVLLAASNGVSPRRAALSRRTSSEQQQHAFCHNQGSIS